MRSLRSGRLGGLVGRSESDQPPVATSSWVCPSSTRSQRVVTHGVLGRTGIVSTVVFCLRGGMPSGSGPCWGIGRFPDPGPSPSVALTRNVPTLRSGPSKGPTRSLPAGPRAQVRPDGPENHCRTEGEVGRCMRLPSRALNFSSGFENS